MNSPTSPDTAAHDGTAEKTSGTNKGALCVLGLIATEAGTTYFWRPFERAALKEANKDIDAQIVELEQGPHDAIMRVNTVSEYNETTGELLATNSDTLHISFAEQLTALKDSRVTKMGEYPYARGDAIAGGAAIVLTALIAALFVKKKMKPV